MACNLLYNPPMGRPTGKTKTAYAGFRVTPQCKAIWDATALRLGISLTAVVEQAIRDFARKNDIDVEAIEHALTAASHPKPE